MPGAGWLSASSIAGRLRGIDEVHIEPVELRGLVTVLNADMERHLQVLRGAIDEVRVKTGGTVPDRA